MYWEQTVQCDAATDIGLRRRNNEDAYSIHLFQDESQWSQCGHVLMVADGMGGHAVGELASRIATETVPHTFLKSNAEDPRTRLHEAIVAANQAIHARGSQNADFLHMGTTCTALALCSRGAVVGHVGDSRAYRIRRDRIDQLTFDHSLEWELERHAGGLEGLVDVGQHKNVITRSLGPEELIDVDIEGPFPVFPGDMFLLCSDGLSNQVSDSEMGAIVRELPPRQAVHLLIDLANVRGGPDNATAIVARIGDLPANVLPPPIEEPPDDRLGLGWSWLIAFAAGSAALAFSIWLMFFGHPIIGSFLFALSFSGLLALIAGAVRARRLLRESLGSDDESHTRVWRPHRTAVGLSSRELLERLLDIDAELHRSAREDGWDVNWAEHDRAVQSAQQSVSEKRYGKGIREVARAIGVIMDELPRRTETLDSAQPAG